MIALAESKTLCPTANSASNSGHGDTLEVELTRAHLATNSFAGQKDVVASFLVDAKLLLFRCSRSFAFDLVNLTPLRRWSRWPLTTAARSGQAAQQPGLMAF